MELPISRTALARLASRFNRDFKPNHSVAITIQTDECIEDLGDELRIWCRRHCNERSKHTVRGVRGIIVMGFESALDAAMFRKSALNDCRALIAAR